MAHYAFLDDNNIVVTTITGVDENLIQTDLDGRQIGGSSEAWEHFYQSLPWFQGLKCKRTSYNGRIRKNYAGIGYTYDENRDAFIAPQPYPSWLLDEQSCQWVAPIRYPQEKGLWIWDESKGDWVSDPQS